MSWETQKEEEQTKTKNENTPEINFINLKEAKNKRGLKVGIYGDFATGKTHFSLTAKEPIYIIDTECGASPLAHLFEDKDIKILDVREEEGCDSFIKYKAAVDFLSKQENVGTVIIDSATDIWSFAQEYAKVKIFKIKPEQRLAQQWDWGTINKLYLKSLLKLINMNANLVLTARAREVYAGAGQPTGILEPKWMKKTGHWVDVVIHNKKKTDKLNNINFSSRIEKCRQKGNLMGKTFNNLDFETLQNKLKEV